MIRTSIHRSFAISRAFALAVAVATLFAVPLAAQDTTATSVPATYVVKKHDTLWDIAKMFLNDPFLWPEIYRLNTSVVEDPHWIYPGETLQLPGAGSGAQVAAVDTSGPGGAQVVSEDQVEKQPAAQQGPRAPVGTTVFAASSQRRVVSASRFGGTANTYSHTAVRAGEFYPAPWLDNTTGPTNTGEIVRTAQLPGEVRGAQRRKFMEDEYLYVTMPKGVVPAKGDRFLTYMSGELVGSSNRVFQPTAILTVVTVDATDAIMVRVSNVFGPVILGQKVIPLEKFTMNPDARPAPLLLGTEGKIVQVPYNVTVANKQDYVILNVGLKDGVKMGDLFTVYNPQHSIQLEGGKNVTIPDDKIGVLQVVKVTEYGATALVVDVRYPAIVVNANVRLTARMP